MLKAMKLVAERMKIVIEASAGASVAAAMFHTNEILKKYPDVTKIGVILCGGNTVLTNFPWKYNNFITKTHKAGWWYFFSDILKKLILL